MVQTPACAEHFCCVRHFYWSIIPFFSTIASSPSIVALQELRIQPRPEGSGAAPEPRARQRDPYHADSGGNHQTNQKHTPYIHLLPPTAPDSSPSPSIRLLALTAINRHYLPVRRPPRPAPPRPALPQRPTIQPIPLITSHQPPAACSRARHKTHGKEATRRLRVRGLVVLLVLGVAAAVTLVLPLPVPPLVVVYKTRTPTEHAEMTEVM